MPTLTNRNYNDRPMLGTVCLVRLYPELFKKWDGSLPVQILALPDLRCLFKRLHLGSRHRRFKTCSK
jgi:hypothetical protein